MCAASGRAPQGQSRGAADVAPALGLPQSLLAQIRSAPSRSGSGAARTIGTLARACRQAAFLSSCARGSCASCAATPPGRTPRSSTIRATRAPTNICSACGPSAKAASSRSSRSIAISASPMQADRLPLRPAERRLFDHCATARRCSLIAGTGATLSIDPASTGGKEWEEFLRAYNEFCSARGGEPLFNQTPFLNREQARKAFGGRLRLFGRLPAPGRPRQSPARFLFPGVVELAAVAVSQLARHARPKCGIAELGKRQIETRGWPGQARP